MHIDLEPVFRVVNENGYVILSVLVFNGFKKAVDIWEKVENTLTMRQERLQKKRKGRRR